MDIKQRIKRSFKLRFALLYPFGILVIIYANSSDISIKYGLGIIILGLLLRSWANGYAIKSEKLTTSGPYAFVRHPLYLGTMLLFCGFVVMLNIYYIGAVFFVGMLAVYLRTIRKEEQLLESNFKQAFLDYKKSVPAIFPSFRPYPTGEKWPFSFKRLIKSQEYKLFIWMIVLVIAFHLKDELLVEKEKIDARMIWLIIISFFLGMIDLFGEFMKWLLRRKNRPGK